MHILIVDDSKIPVKKYGAVERFIWWLGEELVSRGIKITYLVGKGSYCPFAEVLVYNPEIPISNQIPIDVDLVHFNFPVDEDVTDKPFLVTIHGNYPSFVPLNRNSVFVSKNQAKRYNGECYVHLGLDFKEYGKVDFNMKREHLLFLANAKHAVKNLDGVISISNILNMKLAVAGGVGESSDNIEYMGMIGGEKKSICINKSKALIFPVIWHEPFGIAVIEALYFGCPVFATPYGSLPELVIKEVGFLSNKAPELIERLKNIDVYNNKTCHEYVRDLFNHKIMTDGYLKLYNKILANIPLNASSPVNYPSDSNRLPLFG